MPHTPRITVIGAGYAGLMAALRLSKRVGSAAHITLVTASDTFQERIRFHQELAGTGRSQHPLSRFLSGTGIQLQVGRVMAIELPNHRVRLADGRAMDYDRLVYALGSSTSLDGVPGAREHALTVDQDDLHALRARIEATAVRGGRLAVCGAGLTGIETATELAEAFPRLRVTLISGGHLRDQFSPDSMAHLVRAFERLHISVEAGVVTSVGARSIVVGERTLPVEACLWAGGFQVPDLAREAGLEVNKRGQIVTDEYLRSASHPEVMACGDAAAPPVSCGAVYMACAAAVPMGATVADNVAAEIAGRALVAHGFRPAGYCVSLGRRDGLIQGCTATGRPTRALATGWLGAQVKESVCRYGLRMLMLTKYWAGAYHWPHGNQARPLPSSSSRELAA